MLLVSAAFAAPAIVPPGEVALSPALRRAPPDEVHTVEIEADTPPNLPIEASSPPFYQVTVPVSELRRLATSPSVHHIRDAPRASAKEVVSEGYDVIMGQDWHADGIDGTGVRIGIVDVGFDRFDLSAELPTDVVTDFSRGSPAASEHGTAVTEVIYDFAPGATYYLATISTQLEMVEVLDWFTAEHVDVINGSLGFDNVAHADGESLITRAVDDAVDAGAIYVAAAGNENDKYRVGWLGWAEDGTVMIAGRSGARVYTSGGYARVSFRWSEPFGAAAQDFDLVLTNDDGTECGRSSDPQDGRGDPLESISAIGCGAVVTATVVPGDGTADPFGLEGYLYAPYGMDAADWTGTEDLTLPGDTRGGITVGAFGWDSGELPDYSSRGPTNDGRAKPDVVAPDGITTEITTNFAGTSAAAPHVAGLAALWVDATGRRRQPEMFRQWVRAHARDLGTPGPDEAFGSGAAYAEDPPPPKCGCNTAPSAGAAFAALLLLRSRR